MPRLVEVPGYVRFLTVSTVSAFGSQVTGLALQILTAVALSASATEAGIVNAARWVPYLLFGLVAGVVVDRWRRKPMMVATDLGRAVLLGAIPVLYALDRLSIPALCLFVFVFGLLSLLFEAANQSYVPQLVPKEHERYGWRTATSRRHPIGRETGRPPEEEGVRYLGPNRRPPGGGVLNAVRDGRRGTRRPTGEKPAGA